MAGDRRPRRTHEFIGGRPHTPHPAGRVLIGCWVRGSRLTAQPLALFATRFSFIRPPLGSHPVGGGECGAACFPIALFLFQRPFPPFAFRLSVFSFALRFRRDRRLAATRILA